MEVSGSAFIPPTPLGRQDGERATSVVFNLFEVRFQLSGCRLGGVVGLLLAFCTQGSGFDPGPLSRAETSFRWCGVVVRRGGARAQVSSMSLDHRSKLRGPSQKALV
ncbi:hypothetical protein TNCV_2556991 [Trichonephila clavipes]|nr:hypothetical protein TNCV_2556991 [Trichonephila clavipes]